ncbi:MAG: zinc ribbon domain-containing protein [Kiritimatiellae bacterium]|nr:zinc ribbon domain-containing protein [Kiritimatiellia bacterium]
MPIYEYVCAACGKTFDHLAKSYSAPAPGCPACGSSRVEKQLSTFSQTSATPAACRSCPSSEGGGGHGCGCGCGCCHHG